MFKRFDQWAKDGSWQRILAAAQSRSNQLGGWIGSSRSTRRLPECTSAARPLRAPEGAGWNYRILGQEPPDHAISRSRGGRTSKIHLVADGRGRPLSMVLTPGNINDTTMLADTIERIHVPARGRRAASDRARASGMGGNLRQAQQERGFQLGYRAPVSPNSRRRNQDQPCTVASAGFTRLLRASTT